MKDRKIDYVILGLLSHEPLSGYDIKKRIDGTISFFWKGSFGSIYPSLAAMESEGLVVKNEADGSGGREKYRYSITESGKRSLVDWLESSKAANDLKYESILKIFFGSAAGAEQTIRNIQDFEQEIRQSLEILKLYKSNLENAPDEKEHVYYYLTVLFGIRAYESYLEWCKEAVETLREIK